MSKKASPKAAKTSKVSKKAPLQPKPAKRIRPEEKHRTFRLTRKKLKQTRKLPSIVGLIKKSNEIIFRNKKLFGGIIVIQAIITFVTLQGLGLSTDLVSLRQQIEDYLGNGADKFGTSLALFGSLVNSLSPRTGQASGMYQISLAVIVSLAVIWATRQLMAGERPGIRDAFYKGMYPIIPFILVMLVIGLQLLPALIGNFLYSTVIANGLAVTSLEKILWLLIFVLLLTLSLYMVASSLFGLYVVTLPDMRPMKALRSARELVLHRRVSVLWRVLVVFIFLSILSLIIFLPLLIFATFLAQPLFILASGFSLVYINVFMYVLYRGLL